ncbi:hypothetical protein SDC9_103988 [bioreactor metagenome]|uniref:Uncharacterized protein n=1 Tax=bioreactor metagenome TaxID=1076179 RepID=A0A645AVK3_9ZZZZ
MLRPDAAIGNADFDARIHHHRLDGDAAALGMADGADAFAVDQIRKMFHHVNGTGGIGQIAAAGRPVRMPPVEFRRVKCFQVLTAPGIGADNIIGEYHQSEPDQIAGVCLLVLPDCRRIGAQNLFAAERCGLVDGQNSRARRGQVVGNQQGAGDSLAMFEVVTDFAPAIAFGRALAFDVQIQRTVTCGRSAERPPEKFAQRDGFALPFLPVGGRDETGCIAAHGQRGGSFADQQQVFKHFHDWILRL